jgi:hypothetical protein
MKIGKGEKAKVKMGKGVDDPFFPSSDLPIFAFSSATLRRDPHAFDAPAVGAGDAGADGLAGRA